MIVQFPNHNNSIALILLEYGDVMPETYCYFWFTNLVHWENHGTSQQQLERFWNFCRVLWSKLSILSLSHMVFLLSFPMGTSISWVVATQTFLEFSPRKLGKMNPFWRAYFSDGWEKTTNELAMSNSWGEFFCGSWQHCGTWNAGQGGIHSARRGLERQDSWCGLFRDNLRLDLLDILASTCIGFWGLLAAFDLQTDIASGVPSATRGLRWHRLRGCSANAARLRHIRRSQSFIEGIWYIMVRQHSDALFSRLSIPSPLSLQARGYMLSPNM